MVATAKVSRFSGLFNDANGDGKVSPNDTLITHIQITNLDANTAITNVVVNDSFASGTTTVAGSIVVTTGDNFSLTGNTPYSGNVLANDYHWNEGTGTAGSNAGLLVGAVNGTAISGNTTISLGAAGSLSIGTDGAFTFTPATGYNGLASFTYTSSDGSHLLGTVTVNLSVSGYIWYVDSGAAPGGDGSYGHAFTSLAPLSGVGAGGGPDHPNDTIFVYDRGVAYSGGITLESGEKLYGSSHQMLVNNMTIGGTGNHATIDYSTVGITLNSGNTIDGFDLFGGSTSAVGIKDNGSSTGTLSISNTNVGTSAVAAHSGQTGAGETVQILHGGAVTATFGALSSTGSTTNNFQISGDASNALSGSLTVNGGTLAGASNYGVAIGDGSPGHAGSLAVSYAGKIQNSGGPEVFLDGTSAGTQAITFSNTITHNGGGISGIEMNHIAGGNINFTGTVDVTNTSSTGNGIHIAAQSGGNVTFSDIFKAQAADGAGLAIGGMSGGTFTVDGSVNNASFITNGIAAGATGAAVSLLNNTGGTIAFTGGGLTIESMGTGTALKASSDNAATTIEGAFNSVFTVSTGKAVDINGMKVGANGITFDNINTSAGQTVAGTAISIASLSTTAGGTFNVGQTTVEAASGGGIALSGNSVAINLSNNANIGPSYVKNTTGVAFSETNGTANITFNGDITKTSSGNTVLIDNHDTGTVALGGNITASGSASGIVVQNSSGTETFTGAKISLSTGTNAGVTLTSNTGGTVNFNQTSTAAGNGLIIATSSGTGFTASGGGTVNVTGTLNTINATSGTALSIVNTTIGASHVTFQKISSGAGGNNGIVLDTTGSSGGLHVTGVGSTADSGGIITGKTGIDGTNNVANTTSGIGIYLNNTSGVQLNLMNLHDQQNFGIYGNNVNGFQLTNSKVNGANGTSQGAPYNEGSIVFNNLTGTATLTNDTVGGGITTDLSITNTTGTLNLTVSGSTFTGLNTGILTTETVQEILLVGGVNVGDAPTINATFTNNTINNHDARGIQAVANDATNMSIQIGKTAAGTGNTFTGMPAAMVDLGHNSTGSFDFNIKNNTFTVEAGTAGATVPINIFNGSAAGSATTFQGNIVGNTITGQNNSGFDGISLTGSGPGTMTVKVDSNNLSGIGGNGINYTGAQNSATNTANLTITNNNVGMGGAAPAYGIQVSAAAASTATATVNAYIAGNNVTGEPAGAKSYRVDARFPTATENLQGYTGAAQDVAAVSTYLANLNKVNNAPAAAADVSASVGLGGGHFGNVVSVAQPQNAQPLEVAAPPPTDTTTVIGDKPVADPVVSTAAEQTGATTTTTTTTTPPASTGTTAPAPAPAPVSEVTMNLTQAQLDTIVAAAIDRWAAAGATPEEIAAMKAVVVTVADIYGLQVGDSTPGKILISANGAGYGWFVDATPGDDNEFDGTGTDLTAKAGSAAAGHVDLLTVVEHELGHQIGLNDSYIATNAADLMYGYVNPGERRLPSGDDVHAATGTPINHEAFALSPVTIGSIAPSTDVDITYESTVNAFAPGTAPTLTGTSSVSYTGSGGTLTATEVISPTGDTMTDNSNPAVVTTQSLAVESLTLGNLVYQDLDKDGLFNHSDVGIGGVTIDLYIDTNNNNVYDAGDTYVTSATTSSDPLTLGQYSFTNLAPGNYVAVIASSNFGPGPLGALVPHNGAIDPDGTATPGTANIDNDNNGYSIANGAVASYAITLTFQGEQGANNDVNNTLDFGFQTNSPPSAITQTTNDAVEDTPYNAPASEFTTGNSDPDGDPFTLTAVGNGSHGTTVLNGDGSVTYTPNANYNGTDSFTYTLTDSHGASSTGTANVTISAVNDPVGAAAPGAVTFLEDSSNNAINGLSISDADAALAPNGVYEVTLSATHGTLTLTTLTGLTFTAGDGTGDTTMTFQGTLSAINTALGTAKYTPDANYNGFDAAGITLHATDTDGNAVATGTGSATSDTKTINVTVTSVNDAPTTANNSVSTAEDTGYAFKTSDFAFADANDSPANSLQAVKIVALPSAGSLTDNGAAVHAGDLIPVADIAGGKLVFTPGANANGSGYASFQFAVQDNGGTSSGGADTSAPATMTINVSAVNDAPTAAINLTGSGVAPLGGEILVNTATANVQTSPQITALSNGGFVVTWQDNSQGNGGATGDTSSYAIKAQVFAAGGAPVGSEILVNTATAGGQTSAQITALSNGGFVVTWQDGSLGVGGATGDNSGFAVKAQVFTAGGAPVGSEILVNTATANSQSNEQITALSNGGFVVTWQDASAGVGGATGDASNFAIKAQVFAAAGTPVGSEILVNTATSGAQVGAHITALSNGGFVVTWQDGSQGVGGATGDTSGGAVKAQVFAAGGTPVGSEILVNTATLNSQGAAQITPLSNGGFVVTWQDNSAGVGGATGDSSGFAVKAQVFTAGGAPVGSEILVNTSILSDQYGPQITALSNGGFVVTWHDLGGGDGDNSGFAVEAQVFTAGGGRVGNEIRVNTATLNDQHSPQITALSNGGFVVTWQDLSQGVGGATGDGSGYAIKAQVFAASGTPVGSELLVNTATLNNQSNAQIKALSNGGFVVTWLDNSGGVGGATGDTSGNALKAQVFGPAPPQAIEQIPLSLKGGLSVADVDGGSGTETVTLSVTYGVLHVDAGTSGASVQSGNDSNSVVLSGTIAQLNALLNTNATSAVTYTANTDTPPASTTLTLHIDDGGSTGAGTPLTGDATTTIAILSVNDAPSGTSSGDTTVDNVVLVIPTSDFSNGFSDLDGNTFAGVTITSLPTAGTLKLGTVDVHAGDVITKAQLDQGLLKYTPPGIGSGGTSPTFTFQVHDNGGTANGGVDTDPTPRVFTIAITPSDLPPVLDLNGSDPGIDNSASYTEQHPAFPLAPSLSVSDSDNANLTGATVSIGSGFQANLDSLTIDGQTSGTISGITYSYNAATGVMTLSGTATVEDYQLLLQQIFFSSSSNAPGTSRDISWTVTDGTLPSTTAHTTLTVTPVNDAPTGADSTISTAEDTPRVLHGSDFGFSDPDGDSLGSVTISSVSGGTIYYDADGAGGNPAVAVTLPMTFTAADLAANKVTFVPSADLNGTGAGSIVFTVTDNSNQADDTSVESNTLTVDVTAVNDAPVATGSATAPPVSEDTPGTGDTVGNIFAGNFSDAADDQSAQTGGSTPNTLAGVAVTANHATAAEGSWQYYNGTAWVDIPTSVSDSSALLLAASTPVRFNPAQDYNGSAPTLDVHLVDSSGGSVTSGATVNLSGPGATGGTTRYSSGTVALGETISAVNDAPVNAFPGAQAVDEDATLTFSANNENAITVSDADAGGADVTVTLSVAHGTLTLGSTTGVTPTNDGTGTVTVTGSIAAVNAALDGLVYTPAANYNGPDAVHIVTSDNGATGGAAQSDTDDVSITVNAVNDKPVVSDGADIFVTEQTAKTVNASASISDVDLDALNGGSGDYAGATLTFDRSGGANAEDSFTIPNGAGFTVVGNTLVAGGKVFATFTNTDVPGELKITFTSSGTPATTALVNAVAQAVQYTNTSDTPPSALNIVYTLNDGSLVNNNQGSNADPFNAFDPGFVYVTMLAVNDAPSNNVPGAQTLAEDGSKTFNSANSNLISISDADDQGGDLTVTLSVAHGTITLSGTTGLTFAANGGDGTADASMTFTGTKAAINAALNGLVYTPTGNFNGDDTLSITTNDNGHTGNGPVGQDVDTVTMHVTAVNDAPTVTNANATAPAINEDTPSATGNTVSSLFIGNYSDAADNQSASGGSSAGAFTGIAVTGNGSGAAGEWQYYNGTIWVNIGAVSNSSALTLNAATPIRFNPAADYNGPAPTLTVHLADSTATITDGAHIDLSGLGATGGTSSWSSGTVVLSETVTAVNDPPVLDLNGGADGTSNSIDYTEGQTFQLLAPAGTVTDVDSPNFAGAVLTVAFTANGTAADILAVVDQGSGVGKIQVSENVIFYDFGHLDANHNPVGPEQIGTLTGGTGGDPLVITFNALVTPAIAQAVLEDIGYENSSNAPSTLTRTVTFTLAESDGATSVPATATINVTGIDDPATAVADQVTTDELTILNGNVLTNDYDPDGPPVKVSEVNGSAANVGQTITLDSGATLKLNADGTFTYNPNHKFDTLTSPAGGETGASNTQAADSFTYTVAGGNTVTVTVTVNGIANAADHLEGSEGNDTITGTPNADYFDLSQGGSDNASGLGGNDAFYFGAAYDSNDKVNGGAGVDSVGLQGDYTGANKVTILGGNMVNVELLSLLSGGPSNSYSYDVTWKDGNLSNEQIMKIYGGNLKAGENFTFNGSNEAHGHFLMYGGLGVDNLIGGALDDGFYFGPGKFTQADHVDGAGGGRNQLGLDGTYTFSADSPLGTFGGNFTNIQTIVLYNGTPNDLANPYPNVYHFDVNNAAVEAGKTLTIYGTPVISSIYFNGAAETDGSFIIYGGVGNDTLIGGGQADVIFGGMGADKLTGGGGNDTFLYTETMQSNGAGTDRILDFTLGDKIDLSQIDADTTTAGNQAFTWMGTNAFDYHAGELRASYDAASNMWTLEADIDGDGHADMTILLTTSDHHILTANDFML